MMEKTPEQAEKIEPQLEKERQGLQKAEESNKDAGKHEPQVSREPYSPEIFLG